MTDLAGLVMTWGRILVFFLVSLQVGMGCVMRWIEGCSLYVDGSGCPL